jgi:hypothetical protein
MRQLSLYNNNFDKEDEIGSELMDAIHTLEWNEIPEDRHYDMIKDIVERYTEFPKGTPDNEQISDYIYNEILSVPEVPQQKIQQSFGEALDDSGMSIQEIVDAL